ncbi:YaiI/YqxD family protein [Nitratiruptor sp. SB155-2]|uniref:UPF0178 protein NIS_0137 n=1 Tax=Nitratiruptor sp. (strain SB155-2) TaxID=387092 RepID=Y137_NITSB|nr:YaiI/YqxD family protein [Nitratiruptor sp. SB155-2]A6Q193.1 RecName: Full=UPF0178 protein NIS_0137 [Nitratiruptor sp. SB155-2]BAF69252.1 conserved hypothetical protein [Nitratiruptor sp. SB155-2]
MTLFIDGDALPNILKPILLRSVERLKIPTKVIANKKIHIGDSPCIEMIIVSQGADRADDMIIELLSPEDLVITADIPLADRVITAGGHAIDHRGTRYSSDNIKHYLAMRNLFESIRESGEITNGPKPFTQKDAHAFANQLSAFLQRLEKRKK